MNGPLPIALIIDDPPINAAYFLRKQMADQGRPMSGGGEFGKLLSRWPDMEKGKIIPNRFWREFKDWSTEYGVKGKFTFLPCPAGLGLIDDQVEGYTDGELAELISLVKDLGKEHYDITPEIFTHTLAWDMEKKELLPETEFGWTDKQDLETLTRYMAGALQILKNVGIIAPGITQPCNFRGDEGVFARAVLEAEKQVNNLSHTYYFLHASTEAEVRSPVVIADKEKDEYVVSVFSAIRADEPFWETIYGDAGDISNMADYFITKDGKKGRFIELLKTESPLVFHAHGQTLYSNGAMTGFRSLQEVVKRVREHLADRVEWLTLSTYSDTLITNFLGE
jgi:hypothetical protein